MKITSISSEAVMIPYQQDFYPTWYPGKVEKGQTIFIARVDTDEGISGFATCEAPFGILPIMQETVKYLETMLLGESPFEIERLILRFRDVARIATRPWLVENALWDIIGKASGQPVYKLFGNARDKVRVYAAWGEIRSLEQRKEDAQQLVQEGFKGVKLRFHQEKMSDDIALVEAVRDAVGDKLDIMVDANQGTAIERTRSNVPPVWSFQRAKETAMELEHLSCAWLEEPLFRYDYDGLARLSQEVDIPIAGGEINRGIYEFKQMLDKGSYDIIQPNCTMSEGISQIRKIAAIADSYGKICNPHAWIPGLGVMQSMHMVAAIPNFTWLEFPYDPPKITPEVFQGIVKEYYFPEADGCIPLPKAPGLGIELDGEKIRKYKIA